MVSCSRLLTLSTFVAFTFTPLPTAASVATGMCEQPGISKRVAAVCQDLKAHVERVNGVANDAKRELPEDSSWGGYIRFLFKGHNTENVFILHLPVLTFRNETVILHLPEFTMKEKVWIWHTPAVRMVEVHGHRPELSWVKDSLGLPAPKVEMKPTVLFHRPEPYMEEHKAILPIPETAMREQRLNVPIPEISMREQKWIISLPSLTLQSIEAKSGEMKEKVKKASAGLDQYKGRFIAAITEDMRDALTKLNEDEKDLVAKRATAVAANSSAEMLKRFDEALARIAKSKSELTMQIEAMQKQAVSGRNGN